MAVREIHCRVDQEIDLGIDEYARQHRLTRSQAIRELLRQALGDPDPVSRGYKEGLVLGRQEILRAAARAAGRPAGAS